MESAICMTDGSHEVVQHGFLSHMSSSIVVEGLTRLCGFDCSQMSVDSSCRLHNCCRAMNGNPRHTGSRVDLFKTNAVEPDARNFNDRSANDKSTHVRYRIKKLCSTNRSSREMMFRVESSLQL
jgi:hypothetical protein